MVNDLNVLAIVLGYLLPICYGIGLLRGYIRATGDRVNHLGTLWLVFWPAMLVAIVCIEIRKAVNRD